MAEKQASEQLELIRSRLPRSPRRPASPEAPASTDPVASVQVDTGLAHLDRPFEYLVPQSLAETAQPGVRVKVRFAGQDLDGFVLERRATAEHEGRLAPLRRVVSPEPVLTPAVLAAARVVAQRYAGSLGDVLRLAIPPRHAAAEKALPVQAPDLPHPPDRPGPAGPAGPGRLRPRGRATRRDGTSSRTSPPVARPPRPGLPCRRRIPPRTGRRRWPRRRAPRSKGAGAASWSYRTTAMSRGSTPPSPLPSAPVGTSASRRTRARRRGTPPG